MGRIEPASDELIATWRELFRRPQSIDIPESELELFLFHIFITLPRDTLLKFLDKAEKFDPKTLEKQRLPLVTGEEFNTYQLTYNFARSMTDERLEKFKRFDEWRFATLAGEAKTSGARRGFQRIKI